MDKEQSNRVKTALITGASSGIGAAFARCFAKEGFRVVLVARNEEKLRALSELLNKQLGAQVLVLPADLAKPTAAANLAAELKRRKIDIDVLVNNAGLLEVGPFTETPASRHQQLIDLNISALTAMLAEFLPPMIERGHGRVLNVASVAGFQAVPNLATYAATKAYVLSLSEALSEELCGCGVTVTVLCPGVTATSIADDSTRGRAMMDKIPSVMICTADEVAAEGYAACIKGDAVLVPGALYRVANLVTRATPRWLVRRMLGVIGRNAG